MSKTTEIVDLSQEQTSSKYGVCYASGSTFKSTGKDATSFVVEHGKRRLVSRVLCITQYFKSRCKACPFGRGEIIFAPSGGEDG